MSWTVFRAVMAALILSGAFEVTGAERRGSGREIYRKQCAKCHGRSGEGVKGKYEERLHGDWSIEKLSRYIDRNMPEGAPEKCVGKDAEAVAQYIYDEFYSREARARKHPPRVELVRLTNRQFLNSVSDLVNYFASQEMRAVGTERGLKATYYNARGFNRDKVIHERLDPAIDFDFGQGSPDLERINTNEFSMQWRGSIRAEETGEYEFVLRTPNGARLWVNDDEDALIDAWVASGNETEHKGMVRLIGGRDYPIKLDYFKFKDKTASISLLWKPPHGSLQVIPQRNLLPERTTPTLVVRAAFPPDDSSVGYERGVAISKAWDEAATQAAIEVANYIVKNLDTLSKSKPEDADRKTKVESFCREFVEAAFRRPLSEEEKRVYLAGQLGAGAKVEEGVKKVVLLALKSPRFLYVGLNSEGGQGVAERLAFGLWDSIPDRVLRELASKPGELNTRAQVEAQAWRMLKDPRARSKVKYFLHDWLQVNHVEDLSKDAQLYPGFSPEIISDLRTSLDLFLEETVWSEESDYRQLLRAEYLYLNGRLSRFYGVKAEPGAEFVKVRFEEGERAGVITHPYLLAAFSYPKSTSPIHRGVFLTRNIIGRNLKPPPMAVVFKDSEFPANLTMREKVVELTRPQACQSCHSVINPLGFSLEHFDAVGRYRTKENDRPIEATSEYITDEGVVVRLQGARDVAEFATGSEHAQNAFIEQLFNHIVKQPMLAYGPEVMNDLRKRFIAAEFNIQKLMVDIAVVSAMHQPKKP